MEVVNCIPSSFKERSYEIRPPKGCENIYKGFVRARGDVGFRNEHWNAWRQSVVSPYLKNMAGEIRLVVQIAPLQLARFKGIVLERDEGEIVEAIVLSQVVEESPHP